MWRGSPARAPSWHGDILAGLTEIALRFELDADADPAKPAQLKETLRHPPRITLA
jgi:hypothetical protein